MQASENLHTSGRLSVQKLRDHSSTVLTILVGRREMRDLV